MTVHDVREGCLKEGGEFILGSRQLETHACYLGYGRLSEGEKGRLIRPGEGHEEIVCVVKGTGLLVGEEGQRRIAEGQAFHIKGENSLRLDNLGSDELVYIIAGGHSGLDHHEGGGHS